MLLDVSRGYKAMPTRRNRLVQRKSFPMNHVYPESAGGNEWWLLDNQHERIHGTSIAGVANDNNSPYDPDVVDAPEDIKRVGNDHEALHNAKLAPDGYYNGFFHHDFQGNYAQQALAERPRRHHRVRRHHRRHPNFAQLADHENDTDDLPEDLEPIMAQMRDHENDTDDVPDEEDLAINDHENDSDDIPEGQDPIMLQRGHSESQAAELVQLSDNSIPHENDTEDIVAQTDELAQYNRHHSKLWNETVNRKAQELDDEMKAEESAVLAKKKSKEDAKLKAAEEAHNRAAEQKKREQAAQEQKQHEARRTVDFAELYGSLAGSENVQLEYADHWADKRHSQYWADRVKDETYRTNAELQAGAEEEHLRSSPHSSHHFKTANLADEYDGMLLQTDYADHWQDKRHSAYWKDRVNTEAKRLNSEWQETFAQANAATSPHNVHSFGATVDFGDEYNGMLVQTGAEYADHWTPAYKHHTQYWNDRVKDASIAENAEIRESLATMDHNASTHNTHHFGSTVDFADEYNGMLLQTESQYADHWADKRHSQYWRDRVHDQALRTNQELLEAFSREDAAASPHNPDHYKTSDLTDEYNGMLVQEGDSMYVRNQDPYRDVRMKALRQQSAPQPHYAPEPAVWNSFTGETNGQAASTAAAASLAQSKYADHWDGGRHHSQLWEDSVKTETKRLARQLDFVNEREARKDSAAFPDYYAAAHE
jgi:hypothetical protein